MFTAKLKVVMRLKGRTLSLTQHQCGPAGYPGLQPLVEDLMEEHDGLTDEAKRQWQTLTVGPSSHVITSLNVLNHTSHNQSHH